MWSEAERKTKKGEDVGVEWDDRKKKTIESEKTKGGVWRGGEREEECGEGTRRGASGGERRKL
jgi:hypothetical protein